MVTKVSKRVVTKAGKRVVTKASKRVVTKVSKSGVRATGSRRGGPVGESLCGVGGCCGFWWRHVP